MSVTRRSFPLPRAGAIAAAQGLALKAQQTAAPSSKLPSAGERSTTLTWALPMPLRSSCISDRRSKVSLIKGENRRKNIYDALVAIDDQIRPALQAQEVRFRETQWRRFRLEGNLVPPRPMPCEESWTTWPPASRPVVVGDSADDPAGRPSASSVGQGLRRVQAYQFDFPCSQRGVPLRADVRAWTTTCT